MTDIVLRMKTLPDLTNEQAWAVVYEGAKEIEKLRAILEFGAGKFVVDSGMYDDKPAVFIRNANEPGGVGESAKRENVPRDCLQPSERVLTFPTAEQAKAVADALCGIVPCDVCGLQVDVQADACHHCG